MHFETNDLIGCHLLDSIQSNRVTHEPGNAPALLTMNRHSKLTTFIY